MFSVLEPSNLGVSLLCRAPRRLRAVQGEGQHLSTSAWWLCLAGGNQLPASWTCQVITWILCGLRNSYLNNFSPVLCGYGRLGSFPCQRGCLFSAGSCSVYLPKAKFGVGGGREDKMFGSCITHLYAMIQVESECSSIFHPLKAWSNFCIRLIC